MRFIFLSVLFLISSASVSLAQPSGDEEALKQAFKDDLGVTEAEIMQFGVNMTAVAEEMKIPEKLRAVGEPNKDNYREVFPKVLNEIFLPFSDAIHQEAKSYFSEEQYQKMQLRIFQFSNSVTNSDELLETKPDMVFGMGFMQVIVGPPDFLELTPEQRNALRELQVETSLDVVGVVIDLQDKGKEEISRLRKELEKASSGEEKEQISRKISDIRSKQVKDAAPKIKKIFADAKKKYDKILTDEQKAKIQKVMDEMPDYLWKALPQNHGKERAWRPGLDSWRPGMGVPENVGETTREARPIRPEGERKFPGSE